MVQKHSTAFSNDKFFRRKGDGVFCPYFLVKCKHVCNTVKKIIVVEVACIMQRLAPISIDDKYYPTTSTCLLALSDGRTSLLSVSSTAGNFRGIIDWCKISYFSTIIMSTDRSAVSFSDRDNWVILDFKLLNWKYMNFQMKFRENTHVFSIKVYLVYILQLTLHVLFHMICFVNYIRKFYVKG